MNTGMKKGEPLTVFACGPVRDCNHDYSKEEPILDDDGKTIVGSTKVCSICGRSAYEDAMWDD